MIIRDIVFTQFILFLNDIFIRVITGSILYISTRCVLLSKCYAETARTSPYGSLILYTLKNEIFFVRAVVAHMYKLIFCASLLFLFPNAIFICLFTGLESWSPCFSVILWKLSAKKNVLQDYSRSCVCQFSFTLEFSLVAPNHGVYIMNFR